MSKALWLAVAAVLAVGGSGARAADGPPMPTPTKEHKWLDQLKGEWTLEGEMFMEPGKPPIKSQATETVRTLGGLWCVSEFKFGPNGDEMDGIMTVGYDPAKKKFVGTWVCSMCDKMMTYEGELDASGKVLTLNTEGPHPTDPTKTAKMRDILELKAPDHRTLKSEMLLDNGQWVTFMTMEGRKKK